jgi:hypothetical protein
MNEFLKISWKVSHFYLKYILISYAVFYVKLIFCAGVRGGVVG